jgi:light-dependent protochlorophyllide reductase
MTGRVVIVTGATSGLGYETARYLCEGGNDVILACRDEEKARRAIDKIKQQNPNALATYLHLDLAKLESVRRFVDEFHATGKRLNVLINNAGVALNFRDIKRQYTVDGFELTMGTNHLGPFLLTNLLLDDLKKVAGTTAGDARVIFVTSTLHDPKSCKRTRNLQPIDLEDLMLFKAESFSGLQAYKNSKAANILVAYELARKLESYGVKVNAVCPGNVPGTSLLRYASGPEKVFYRCVLHGMLRFTKLTRSVPQAASYICSAATDDKYKDVTGKYIREGQETSSSEETLNEELAKTLWDLSGRYAGLDGYEPLAPPPRPADDQSNSTPPQPSSPPAGPKCQEDKSVKQADEYGKAGGETHLTATDGKDNSGKETEKAEGVGKIDGDGDDIGVKVQEEEEEQEKKKIKEAEKE